jgi:hypothetical protein
VFHKKAKTTKKIVLRLQCSVCKACHMHPIKVREYFGSLVPASTSQQFMVYSSRMFTSAMQQLRDVQLAECSVYVYAALQALRNWRRQEEQGRHVLDACCASLAGKSRASASYWESCLWLNMTKLSWGTVYPVADMKA